MRIIKTTIGLVSFFIMAMTFAPVGANAVSISQPASNVTLSSTTTTVKGTATPGRTVVISQNGATLGSVVTDGSGNWTINVVVPAGNVVLKATEISSSYGYFGTLGGTNNMNRVLSGSSTINDSTPWPLTTTNSFFVPVGTRPQADALYWTGIGDATRVPAQLDLTTPVDPVEVTSYPVNPNAGTGAFNLSGTKLYVPNDDLNTVSVVDYATNTVVDSIALPSGYVPSLSAGSNGFMYVPVDSTIQVIDPNTDTIIKSVPIDCPNPTSLGYVSFPRGRDYYYVPCSQDGIIFKLKLSDDSVMSRLDVSTLSTSISIVTEGFNAKKLYVSGIFGTASGNKIFVVDASTGSLISSITLTADSVSNAITPDGQYIYASTQGLSFDTTNIDIISTQTNTIVNQIDTSSLGVPGIIAWLPGQETETSVSFTVTLPKLAETGSRVSTYLLFALVSIAASGLVIATFAAYKSKK